MKAQFHVLKNTSCNSFVTTKVGKSTPTFHNDFGNAATNSLLLTRKTARERGGRELQ